MKKKDRLAKILIAVLLCACVCVPFTVSSFASAPNHTPAASSVPAKSLVIPKGVVVEDQMKGPTVNAESNKTSQAVTVKAKKIPSGVTFHHLVGRDWPTDMWNWADEAYYGSFQGVSSSVFTNYCCQPTVSGKLWMDTDFQSSTGIGYSFRITCYDRNTGSAVASWTSHTAPARGSSATAVSFDNLNRYHIYFFQFENTQGTGTIQGNFDIEHMNS
ncbi:MAG TPA: hypothetical protein VHP31_06740 [Caproicibacter sp.]|nr:hypothetical protein [Caproicibacter sp.]